VANIHA